MEGVFCVNDLKHSGKVRNGLFLAGIGFGIMAALVKDLESYALILALMCAGCLAGGFAFWGMIAKESRKMK
ncbi:hypothetical protein CBF27_12160 [Vagococcus acidifermentans]|uniref:Uncharacterized protein n=1 Tax=Vagococcus acidifermentans TaxID=564710 RepID=A0A430ANK0_9ENTE|nr:hypothetical protein CBF27_12160 [Vagococcus acidifermentans]